MGVGIDVRKDDGVFNGQLGVKPIGSAFFDDDDASASVFFVSRKTHCVGLYAMLAIIPSEYAEKYKKFG